MLKPALLALVMGVIAAGQASAHARLLHATPRVGSVVKPGPHELILQFSESIDLKASSVSLTGPRGAVAAGPLERDPSDPHRVHLPIAAALPPGSYRVRWDMTSVDTHHTNGDFTFRVAF
jgi:hypothetical protein